MTSVLRAGGPEQPAWTMCPIRESMCVSLLPDLSMTDRVLMCLLHSENDPENESEMKKARFDLVNRCIVVVLLLTLLLKFRQVTLRNGMRFPVPIILSMPP